VKIHRNYSVEDITRLFGIHKNTVRNWLKQGLPAIDDRRPILILGRELSRFLYERRQKAKQACGPGWIFCIACRAPKIPAGKMADCTATGPLAGSLCGICPDCHRLIYRRVCEDRCGSGRTGDHVHTAPCTYRREGRPLREL
jgi:hypothetical protein